MKKLSDSPAARRRRERLIAEERATALRRSAAPFGHAWPNDLAGSVHDAAECMGQRVCVHMPRELGPNASPLAQAWARVRKLWPDRDVRLQGGVGERRVIVAHHASKGPLRGLYCASVIGRGNSWDEAIQNAVEFARRSARGGPGGGAK